MFERDYIMRILQNFFEDIARLIHGRHRFDDEQQLDAFGDLYKKYLKEGRNHFYASTAENILASFNDEPDGVYKAEMLANLLYHDACLQNDETIRKELLEKSLTLYRQVNVQSKDFSLERHEMIGIIGEMLR